MNEVFLLLGSNVGVRLQNIENAMAKLEQKAGVLIDCSSVYETEPWGFVSKTHFLNVVVGIKTHLSAEKLLEVILEIEKELGRVRQGKTYSSRTIDIDILFYNSEIINKIHLTVPHPEIPNRQFTLIPMCEIAGKYIHPQNGLSMQEMLFKCRDKSKVSIYKKEKLNIACKKEESF